MCPLCFRIILTAACRSFVTSGIAKGMFVTLREMFSKTMVEDYPSKKLPSKGAAFHERFRDIDCNPRGFAQTAQ